MKTAVSIPDPLFEAAERTARQLGVSRSELYASALAAFLERRDADRITEALNEVYAAESSTLDPLLAELQACSLPAEEW